ncbi:hypothetical protein T265_07353 [Opisthorchis viverrini]|uniref:Uncharacterized protein n=1 Tax=Opisthorchis viverrini TaxID=6198 RepID=A0A075ABV2_OPIVI|nr:hypothetical protein T265_07353 [Opisthorchis viverrini]KER25129.1 hypothetical protein T265_07353 [Opisthorchis viverrini]
MEPPDRTTNRDQRSSLASSTYFNTNVIPFNLQPLTHRYAPLSSPLDCKRFTTNPGEIVAHPALTTSSLLVIKCLQSSCRACTTSVFNTDTLLPYNHHLLKTYCKENSKGGRGRDLVLAYYEYSGAIWIGTDNKNATDIVRITRPPSWKASSTDSTQAFRDLLHTPLPGQGVYATLNRAWKTTLSSANDGSAYATHVPTNAASGAGHIIQPKYPLHNRKLVF